MPSIDYYGKEVSVDTIDKIVFSGLIAVLLLCAIALVIVIVGGSNGPEIGTALMCENINGVVVCVER